LSPFKALVDEGQSAGQIAGQIAAAFGVSVLTVQRRLKLARLAPQFIDLYREGGIEMEVLQALALSDDPAQQVKVWESLEPYKRSAYQIRQLLTDGEVEAASPLAVFVGIAAYRAAGGAVCEDLFLSGGDGDDRGSGSGGFLQDAALLNRLALDRLEAEAAKLREGGWKWVEARISFPYAERSRFAQLLCDKATPGRKEQAAIDAAEADRHRIRARMDELEALAYDAEVDEDCEWTTEQQAELDALEEQFGALESQLEAMDEALREWTPQQKAIAGVVLSVDRDGQLCCVEGLVSSGDRKAVQEAAKGAGQPGDDRTIDGDDERHSGASFALPTFDKAPKERAEYPALLCQSMTAHRTAAVGCGLHAKPQGRTGRAAAHPHLQGARALAVLARGREVRQQHERDRARRRGIRRDAGRADDRSGGGSCSTSCRATQRASSTTCNRWTSRTCWTCWRSTSPVPTAW
jgi:ParB family chromosome partitioning protein